MQDLGWGRKNFRDFAGSAAGNLDNLSSEERNTGVISEGIMVKLRSGAFVPGGISIEVRTSTVIPEGINVEVRTATLIPEGMSTAVQ